MGFTAARTNWETSQVPISKRSPQKQQQLLYLKLVLIQGGDEGLCLLKVYGKSFKVLNKMHFPSNRRIVNVTPSKYSPISKLVT